MGNSVLLTTSRSRNLPSEQAIKCLPSGENFSAVPYVGEDNPNRTALLAKVFVTNTSSLLETSNTFRFPALKQARFFPSGDSALFAHPFGTCTSLDSASCRSLMLQRSTLSP